MAIRNGPLWDKVIKGAVCLGLFLAFWSVQWVIPDFYQELFRLSLAGDVDVLIDYISSFGIFLSLSPKATLSKTVLKFVAPPCNTASSY
jgi:hypothetical protein